ncbi:MAG: DNA-deoxyinosine glycosylase [Janthinobacterium lividum]
MTRKTSFHPVVRADARLLVLGSLPGERSLAEARYYAHPQNQFWRLMSPVAGCDLPALAYADRLEALTAARIALWDVVASAHRRGSTDAAIREATSNDLPALVDALPALRAVAFNGGAAAAIGRRMLAGRAVALVTLPSSSPLHTVGIDAKRPAWSALAAYVRP